MKKCIVKKKKLAFGGIDDYGLNTINGDYARQQEELNKKLGNAKSAAAVGTGVTTVGAGLLSNPVTAVPGAIVSAAGLITTGVSSLFANRDKRKIKQSTNDYNTTYANALTDRNQYQSDLTASVADANRPRTTANYFANGGKMIPTSANTKLAIGDTHSQDTDHDGQSGMMYKGANIEGGEVVHDKDDGSKFVFTNRIHNPATGNTFAKDATAITMEKGKVDKKIIKIGKRPSNVHTKGSQSRLDEISKAIEGKVDQLASAQEATKQAMGIPSDLDSEQQPISAFGGKVLAMGGFDDEEDGNRYGYPKINITPATSRGVNTTTGYALPQPVEHYSTDAHLPINILARNDRPSPKNSFGVLESDRNGEASPVYAANSTGNFDRNTDKILPIVQGAAQIIPQISQINSIRNRPKLPVPTNYRYVPTNNFVSPMVSNNEAETSFKDASNSIVSSSSNVKGAIKQNMFNAYMNAKSKNNYASEQSRLASENNNILGANAVENKNLESQAQHIADVVSYANHNQDDLNKTALGISNTVAGITKDVALTRNDATKMDMIAKTYTNNPAAIRVDYDYLSKVHGVNGMKRLLQSMGNTVPQDIKDRFNAENPNNKLQ